MADGGRLHSEVHGAQQDEMEPRSLVRMGSKLYPLPDLDIRQQYARTRMSLRIARAYSPEQLVEISHFLSAPHAIIEWMIQYDDIAIRLSGTSLFLDVAPIAGHQTTRHVFETGYAPALHQDPAVASVMKDFFEHLAQKMASENVD